MAHDFWQDSPDIGSVKVRKGVQDPDGRDNVPVELADKLALSFGPGNIRGSEGDLVEVDIAILDILVRELALIVVNLVRHGAVSMGGVRQMSGGRELRG
jgi:hypothetical protein